jgi:anti-anti-sigma regulatory factor
MAGRRGSLALAAPPAQIRRILATTGLTKVLAVYDLEAGAVQACRAGGAPGW